MTAPGQKNDLQAEIQRYQKSLEENPGSRLFAALADAMRRSGDIVGAITVAENGLKRHPRYLGGMVALGQAYADNQQYDRGKELFLQVVRMSPENIVAQRALAEIYDRLGENFNAMRTYASLSILDPADKKVRARLHELEESRAGAGPVSAPKPSVPPPVPAPAPVAPEASVKTGGEPTPQPEPVASKASVPAGSHAVPVALAQPPTSVPDVGIDPLLPAQALRPAAPAPAPEPTPPPEPAARAPRPEVEKRMAGLGQFFEDDQARGPEPPPAVPARAEPDAQPEAPPAEIISEDEGSGTILLPAKTAFFPGPPPPPGLTVEEKLDLFFGGADLNQVGVAGKAESFVVRQARDALAEQDPGDSVPPPPAATAEVGIIHSKLGAIFWDQGFREKALAVMAEEIRSRPGDARLRAEFGDATRSIGRDPEAMLEGLSPGLSVCAEEPAPEPEPPAPEPGAVAETSPPVAAPGGATAKAADEPGSSDQRVNILRSYLNRVRKDKES